MPCVLCSCRSQLAEGSKDMLAVQECYITVCREKDALEQDLRARMEEERKSMEEEVCSTQSMAPLGGSLQNCMFTPRLCGGFMSLG